MLETIVIWLVTFVYRLALALVMCAGLWLLLQRVWLWVFADCPSKAAGAAKTPHPDVYCVYDPHTWGVALQWAAVNAALKVATDNEIREFTLTHLSPTGRQLDHMIEVDMRIEVLLTREQVMAAWETLEVQDG